ncbi:hypothetical protein [Staphylococcus schweitzeri]|uniref:Uncharacterized protein n=1 Tax=Staphylococcus schweitzeri TaxID=1654388 RepID=A0A077UDU3_9STAP|nr:hypothetical protein [Staphylococcus schweitzeri]CDR26445.1 hypothetical protein ERS140147_00003 [Staphylococcus schweitzeri]
MWSILSAIISFLGVLYIFYKTREFQMNMHKDRLEEDAKNNQPAFVFQPLEIYYEFKGYNKNYIKKNWIYKDSDSYNDNVLNDFKNDYFYKSFLRFRNIGNGIAKNVTITYSHIDALKYLNQVNGVSYYPLNHKFQFIKEDRKYGIAYISGEPEKGTYRFKVNSNKKYSIKKFRFINNKDYF